MTQSNTANEYFKKSQLYLKKNYINGTKYYLLEAIHIELEDFKKNHENKGEFYFAHYTSIETLYSLLYKYDGEASEEKKADNKEGLRLYDAYYLNDPNEGKFLVNSNLFETCNTINKIKDMLVDTESFICSFVCGNKNVGDKLEFWQSYGKGGLGCSIQLSNDYQYKKELENVYYGDTKIKILKKKMSKYIDYADRLYNFLKNDSEKEEFSREFLGAFDKIRYLWKREEYQYEKEARLVIMAEPNKQRYDLKDGLYLKRYVLDNRLKTQSILTTGSKVVIGPAVRKNEHLCSNLKKFANKKGLKGPDFKISNIPYQKFW